MKKDNYIVYPAWKSELDEILNHACYLVSENCDAYIADVVINTLRCASYCVGHELHRTTDLPF